MLWQQHAAKLGVAGVLSVQPGCFQSSEAIFPALAERLDLAFIMHWQAHGQSCCFQSWQPLAAMQGAVRRLCPAISQQCPHLAPCLAGDLSASELVVGQGVGLLAGEGPGVLEIKCPFNRGTPQNAAPPKLPQWYYMPQVTACLPAKKHMTRAAWRAAICPLTMKRLPDPSGCQHYCTTAIHSLVVACTIQGMASSNECLKPLNQCL